MFDSDKAGKMHSDIAKKKWRDVVDSVTMGSYKDPGKCAESLTCSEFKKFILKRINPIF